jgi:hypothetical protein
MEGIEAMPITPDSDLPEQDGEDDLYVDRPAPENFSTAVREAPLTALATAFVAGLVVGRLIL